MRRPSLSLQRRRVRGGDSTIDGVGGIGLVLLIIAAYLAWSWVPVWIDQMAVREIASNALLEWADDRDLSRAKAHFLYQLEHKGVSDDPDVSDCRFTGRSEGDYRVDCAWTRYAYYPGTDYYKAFPLRVRVTLQHGRPVILP